MGMPGMMNNNGNDQQLQYLMLARQRQQLQQQQQQLQQLQQQVAANEASLMAGGNADFQVKAYPQLNHLFQHCETGAIAEYATIEETFSPEALELISDWILKRYGK